MYCTINMCISIYIYIYIYVSICIHTYIYIYFRQSRVVYYKVPCIIKCMIKSHVLRVVL